MDNPAVVRSQDLRLHSYPSYSHIFSNSRVVVIDSNFRNTTSYPNPSEFRTSLTVPAQGVKSIRLLWVNIPTPTAVSSPYLIIASKILQHIEFSQDPDMSSAAPHVSGLASEAFAVIPIKDPLPNRTVWMNEHPITKNWIPELPKLSTLDFSLRTADGELYDTDGQNWSMCLEILSNS